MKRPTNTEEQRYAKMNQDAQVLFAQKLEASPSGDLEQIMAHACQAAEEVVRDFLSKRQPEQRSSKRTYDMKTMIRQSYEFFFIVEEEQLNFFVECAMEFSGDGELSSLSFYPSAPPFCHA